MNNIPASKYEGYIWMSDATAPEVLHEPKDFLGKEYGPLPSTTENPFVIEAQLYDPASHMSYGVKHVDGEYIVTEVDLSKEALKGCVYEEKTFLPHRMEGISALRFYQFWREEDDEFCDNMKVLQPKELAFAGFITKEEKV